MAFQIETRSVDVVLKIQENRRKQIVLYHRKECFGLRVVHQKLHFVSACQTF